MGTYFFGFPRKNIANITHWVKVLAILKYPEKVLFDTLVF